VKAELERLGEPDVFKLGRGGKRLDEIATVERSAKSRVCRVLRGHEQMFAEPPSSA
jgi:hypothetical protein